MGKEVGGLGVRRIREFNIALLGKWCWRLLVEKERLWYRVLSARYGEVGGRLLDGGRLALAWWCVIASLRREAWFNNHVCRSVGNGKHIYFWSDVWIGGMAFKDRFSRLIELSVDKWVSVFDCFQLGWDVNGEDWKWRRRLLACEEDQVGELCLLLQHVTLQVDKEDRWLWNLEKSNVYSIRNAYNFQTAQFAGGPLLDVKMIWQKYVPLKVVVFAWRLFRNRLATKDNLFRRGVINNNSCLYVSGCGSLENVNHLFLHCSFFGAVWCHIMRWVGFSMVTPFAISDHCTQFSFVGGGPCWCKP